MSRVRSFLVKIVPRLQCARGQFPERLAVVGVAVPNNSTLHANWSRGGKSHQINLYLNGCKLMPYAEKNLIDSNGSLPHLVRLHALGRTYPKLSSHNHSRRRSHAVIARGLVILVASFRHYSVLYLLPFAYLSVALFLPAMPASASWQLEIALVNF